MGCERCVDRGELVDGRAAEEAAPATSKVRGKLCGCASGGCATSLLPLLFLFVSHARAGKIQELCGIG